MSSSTCFQRAVAALFAAALLVPVASTLAQSCTTDNQCTAGTWCNETLSTCTPKLVNGQPIPNDPAHKNPTLNGTCTAQAGATVCVSNACDTADNKCGYANGDGPCGGPTVCRSGVCSNGTCKGNQTITFGGLSDKTFGDADFVVSASGGASGNPVTFGATGNCASSGTNGSTIHLTGAGTCTVTASQAGSNSYNAAPDVSQSFNIAKATPVITWSNPADITYGTALSDTQLNATASVPGSFVYAPAAGTILSPGANQTLSVNFTPTDTTDYNNASQSVSINVNAATPSITLRTDGPQVTITFTGILQQSSDLYNWQDVAPQPISPWSFNPSVKTFFRARQ